MPVIRDKQTNADTRRRSKAVKELLDELLGHNARGEILVVEVPIHGTNTYHVIVVWDAWRLTPPQERAGVILDAYEKYDAATLPKRPTAPDITIAMGLTWDDPLLRQVLPYSVEFQAGRNAADPKQVQRLLLDEGAAKTPSGLQLRFPNAAGANEAVERLRKRMPSADWRVVGVGPSIDD